MLGLESVSPDQGVAEDAVTIDPRALGSLDQFRALAMSLERSRQEGKSRAVVITSALAGEGKTFTAANLATTLTDSFGRRVLLMEGDLRNPNVHRVFRSEMVFGAGSATTETIPAGLDLGLTLGQATPTFYVLGWLNTPPSDPIRLLNLPGMKLLLDWARSRFDWILIDSPPTIVPDAAMLAQLADGVLFVVSSGATPFDAARRGIEGIGAQRVLGAVMNRVSDDRAIRYLDYKRSRYLKG